jgi:hypothetical protein
MKKSKKEILFIIMNTLAWVVFIGSAIKAGAIIISWFVSIGNPHAAHDLYMGMDLYAYRLQSFWYYSIVVWNKIIMCIAYAFIPVLVTSLFSKQNIRTIH